jgi:proteasome activator subunit 4
MHCNPLRSDPARLTSIPHTRFSKSRADESGMDVDDVLPNAPAAQQDTSNNSNGLPWPGIRKEVGILTEREFEMVMTKCLRSMGTPVGGAVASVVASRTQMVCPRLGGRPVSMTLILI